MFKTLTPKPLPVVLRTQAWPMGTTDRQNVIVLTLGTIDPGNEETEIKDIVVAMTLREAAGLIKTLAGEIYGVVSHYGKAR